MKIALAPARRCRSPRRPRSTPRTTEGARSRSSFRRAGGRDRYLRTRHRGELSRELKVAIAREPAPARAGALGTGLVVKSKPDGYTIILTNNASLVFRRSSIPKTANYNPLTDLTPLDSRCATPASSPARRRSLQDLRKDGRTFEKESGERTHRNRGGRDRWAIFCVLTLNSLTGAGLTTVPFTGASPAVTALLGGHVEGVVLALGTMTGHLRSARCGASSSRASIRIFRTSRRCRNCYRNSSSESGGILRSRRRTRRNHPALVPDSSAPFGRPPSAPKLRPLGMLMDYSPPEKLLTEIRDEHAPRARGWPTRPVSSSRNPSRSWILPPPPKGPAERRSRSSPGVAVLELAHGAVDRIFASDPNSRQLRQASRADPRTLSGSSRRGS